VRSSCRRIAPRRGKHSLHEGEKEENCSLPLMTPSNNISEARRGPYLPLPRRPTWKGRPNSGMSSARDAVSDLKTFTVLLLARHVYISVVDDAPFETLLEYCCGGNIPFPSIIFFLSLSFPFLSPRRIHPRELSKDRFQRIRKVDCDECWVSINMSTHLNWMSIRRDLISPRCIKYRVFSSSLL